MKNQTQPKQQKAPPLPQQAIDCNFSFFPNPSIWPDTNLTGMQKFCGTGKKAQNSVPTKKGCSEEGCTACGLAKPCE